MMKISTHGHYNMLNLTNVCKYILYFFWGTLFCGLKACENFKINEPKVCNKRAKAVDFFEKRINALVRLLESQE